MSRPRSSSTSTLVAVGARLALIAHMGLFACCAGADEALAATVPDIDIILSGHSHTFTPAPVSAGGAVVVQSGSFAQFVVRLDVDVDLTTHAVTVLDYDTRLVASEPPSAGVASVVAASMARYAPDALRAAGRLERGHTDLEVAEITALAATRQYAADAAIVDVRTVWQGWSAGELTQQDLARARTAACLHVDTDTPVPACTP